MDSAAPGSATTSAPGDLPTRLSPSRASDFMQCPQLFKYRSIDRIPEPATEATARGTLVHAVLEDLYAHVPRPERSPGRAVSMLPDAWRKLAESDRGVVAFRESGEVDDEAVLAKASELLQRYFTLEDPTRLEPASTEQRVEVSLTDDLRLSGYIDRVDVAPTGQVRVVDYKTGKSPRAMYESKAMFQMLFYGLVWWRSQGIVPTRLALHYLGDGVTLTKDPSEADLAATERKVFAIWEAINRAYEAQDWRPTVSKLCDWCYHKGRCPAWTT